MLLRLYDGVCAVDDPLLFQHLAQQLGAPGRLQRGDLGRRRRARLDADPQAAGLDLLARDVGIPEREDVPGIGRAHLRRALRLAGCGLGVKWGSSEFKGGPQAGPSTPMGNPYVSTAKPRLRLS